MKKQLIENSAVLVAATLIGATSLLACAVDFERSGERGAEQAFETRDQAILGGAPTDAKKYEAVGALAIRFDVEIEPGVPFVYYDSFCTGTLIADKAVLTARHCTQAASEYVASGLDIFFVFGELSFEPEQAIQIVDWKEAPSSKKHPGLLLDGGRDIAVAYLAKQPKGITPAKIAEFDKKKQVDDKFEIIGYGYSDYLLEDQGYYEVGVKMAGKATGRSLGGKWYSLLFDGDYDAYLEWYFTDAVTDAPSEEQALEWWNIYNLEPGYEFLAGSPDESLGCFGDSGGPLAISKKNKLTVYGVSFATESSLSNICTGGGAYLVLNEKIYDFVKDAIKHCRH